MERFGPQQDTARTAHERRAGFSTLEFNAEHAVLIVCEQGLEICFMEIDWGQQ
jgi:hypothetical protein